MPEGGRVSLVGAGPGDPELITVRGLRRLRAADVVVYDRLVAPELLGEAPSWAELVYAGKARGQKALAQDEIHAVLIDRAHRGLSVVRLKGGDPFVFGRGGEEAAALRAAGVEWEVVPAVSSALAAPACASIPVTHRGVAASFAVVPGHRAAGEELDWSALAAVDTLVILMAVTTLPQISARLIEHGRPAGTPAAVVERASLPDQRVITGTLGDIAHLAAEQGVQAPATVVVGDVVALRPALLDTLEASIHHRLDRGEIHVPAHERV